MILQKQAPTRRGFTLVEALAALVLLGVGIAAVVTAQGSLGRTESRMQELQVMARLAESKLAELMATEAANVSDTGDFTLEGDNDHEWELVVDPSGVENVNALRLIVRKVGGRANDPEYELNTLQFVAPGDGTTGATQ